LHDVRLSLLPYRFAGTKLPSFSTSRCVVFPLETVFLGPPAPVPSPESNTLNPQTFDSLVPAMIRSLPSSGLPLVPSNDLFSPSPHLHRKNIYILMARPLVGPWTPRSLLLAFASVFFPLILPPGGYFVSLSTNSSGHRPGPSIELFPSSPWLTLRAHRFFLHPSSSPANLVSNPLRIPGYEHKPSSAVSRSFSPPSFIP